ncbi:MAG: peptidoglycan DD-metalloendopeptidase family protein [Clostridia bacterium]|nr:peptidoglycan DD-metalloendopeptidase family protein [Clostridia bacterium]
MVAERIISGSLLIMVILLVRQIMKGKLPKRTFCIMWWIALFHLLSPKLFFSPVSIFALRKGGGAAVFSGAVDPVYEGASVMHAVLPEIPPETSYSMDNIMEVVWLAGVLMCIAVFVVTYIAWTIRFQRAGKFIHPDIESLIPGGILRCVSVRQSGMINTPVTYGLLRPVILIPEGMEEDSDTLSYVFAHEIQHIRKGDLWLKLFLAAAASCYWFLPPVWLMYAAASRDIELACDEAVLSRLGLEHRRGYAMALIRMEENKRRWSPLVEGFSNSGMEERITAIMNKKNYPFAVLAASVAVVMCITFVFAASAEKPEDDIEGPVQQAFEQVSEAADSERETEEKPEQAATEADENEDANVVYWPSVFSRTVTNRFGMRTHPITGEERFHDHINIRGDKEVIAAMEGKVMEVYYDKVYGNVVKIDHGNNYVTAYGHLAEVEAWVGRYMKGGEVIGTAGATGQATGVNLAFWVYYNGEPVDPMSLYGNALNITFE